MQNIPQMLQSPISCGIVLISLSLSILTTLNIFSKYAFALDFYAIKAGEYYRFITGVLFLGKISFFNVLFIINNLNYISQLEKQHFTGNIKKFIAFLSYIYFFTILTSYIFKIKDAASCFFGSMTYLWVRLNPESIFVFLGFLPLQAPLLPFLNLTISYLNQKNIIPMLIGYFLGHIFWLLDVVLPEIIGKKIIKI